MKEELERLKRRLLKQEPSKNQLVYALCEVMQVCGGYNVLCGYDEEIEYKWWKFKWKKKITRKGMSISALNQILKYIDWKRKEEEKSYGSIKSHGLRK